MPSFFWTQKQDIGPSRRTSHALAYDSERTQVVLFGGDPGGPPLDDTWAWDGALWTQVADTGPSARHSLAMVFDSARKQIVLFGRRVRSNLLADTWTWNGTEWTQVADTGPAARSGSRACLRRRTQAHSTLRWADAANPLGDTWEWDGTEWTQVQDVGPSARRAQRDGLLDRLDRLPHCPGLEVRVRMERGSTDTWLWDGAAWTQAADTGPDPRAACAMVAATSIVLFGGVNSIDPGFSVGETNHLWRYVALERSCLDGGPGHRTGATLGSRHGASERSALLPVGSCSSVDHPPSALPRCIAADGRHAWTTWEVPDESAAPGSSPAPVTISVLGITLQQFKRVWAAARQMARSR
jgi:hypothetical protein